MIRIFPNMNGIMTKRLLSLFLFPAIPLMEAGEGPAPSSIAHFEHLAMVNNPTVVQAEAIVEGELGKAEQAGLYPNPTIGYIGEQIGAPSESRNQTAGEFQGGFVQQRFVVPAKLDLSRKKYLQRAKISKVDQGARLLAIRNDVRLHGYRVLGWQEKVKIQQELLESSRDGMLTAKESFNVGQANEVDLSMASIALKEQDLNVKMAENELHAAWREMMAVVGIETKYQPLGDSLTGTIPAGTWEDVWKDFLLGSPQVAVTYEKLKADEITLRRERIEPIPDLTLEGSYGHNFEVQRDVFNASASIPLPIFDRNQGTVRQAKADLARQQGEVFRVQAILRQQLAGVFMRLETARQHVLAYRDAILPEAKGAYTTALKSYKANRLDWPSVLDVQQFYFMKRMQYIDLWVALREAKTELDGFMLTNGLAPPELPTPPGHIDAVAKPR